MPDKREGLKAGKYDAGEAALNMKLVASMRQPEGMFDPNGAGGLNFANSDLAFGMNGRIVLQGNFHGLMFYNIEDPSKASLQSIVPCPGGQGDTSIYGHLAFMSVEGYGRLDCGVGRPAGSTPPTPAAGAAPPAAGARAAGAAAAPPDPDRMYGVRIFDITDPRAAETGGGRADLPRLAHAFDRHGSEGQGQHLHLRVRHLGHSLGRREGGLRLRSE